MQISEGDLRQLVRDAVAKQTRRTADRAPVSELQSHASHVRLPLARGGDGDGACLIEPAVRCNHCGYCLSFGH